MWIRSQNRQMLLDCRGVRIVNCCSIDICCYEIYGYGMSFETKQYLGSYSTEEKALKVLDMFQECVANGNQITKIFNNYSMEYTDNYKIENNGFQMPQDEEVK